MRRDLKILLAASLLCNLAAVLFAWPSHAGTLYIDTGGAATNSCSRDVNAAALSGTGDAVVTGSTVQLTVGVDLSGVNATAGSATQDTIYIAQATNSNTKIFWITAKDDGLDQVTVSVAPTGVTASNWAIGGRCILTNASQEAALRAGDTLIFNNSPASQSATVWTFRNSGSSASGYAKIMGKAGVRPVLTATSTNNGITCGGLNYCWIENLEVAQQGATASAVSGSSGTDNVIYNVKVTDAGSGGGILASGYTKVIGCDISGSAGDGISFTGSLDYSEGNYIHDNTGNGITYNSTTGSVVIKNNIIDTNAGKGVYLQAAIAASPNILNEIEGNTIYANGDSGLEVVDADNIVTLTNNIFVSNGDAAGEYNVEWVAGSGDIASFHAWNDFYQGGGSAGNLLNITVNAQVAASEITTDPVLSSPATGNFTITSTSPAAAIGFPGQLLGATGRGYLSLGAQVPTPAASSSGGGIIGG